MKRLSKDQKQQRADLVTRPMPTNSNPYSATGVIDNSPAPSRLVNADALARSSNFIHGARG